MCGVDKSDMSHSTAVAAAPSPLRDISCKHPAHKATHSYKQQQIIHPHPLNFPNPPVWTNLWRQATHVKYHSHHSNKWSGSSVIAVKAPQIEPQWIHLLQQKAA